MEVLGCLDSRAVVLMPGEEDLQKEMYISFQSKFDQTSRKEKSRARWISFAVLSLSRDLVLSYKSVCACVYGERRETLVLCNQIGPWKTVLL